MAIQVASTREIANSCPPMGEYRAVAQVEMTAAEFAQQLGVTFLEDDEAGLGRVAFQCFRVDNGPYFILSQYLDDLSAQRTIIETVFDYASQNDPGQADLPVILQELGVPARDVSWQLDAAQRQNVIADMRGKIQATAPPPPQP